MEFMVLEKVEIQIRDYIYEKEVSSSYKFAYTLFIFLVDWIGSSCSCLSCGFANAQRNM